MFSKSRTPGTQLRAVCDLARGGMGYVELSLRQDGRFRRLYAVKRPHTHLQGDQDFRAMFMDEARVAGLLRHANIISVIDVGEDATGPYMAMDYVEGLSLKDIVKYFKPSAAFLPVWFVVRVAAQICRGLHAAHSLPDNDGQLLHLVHRDISPQNVLVGYDGVVRILDFGIAKAFGNVNRTSTGLLKGNIAYMSPEQLRLERVDLRSDLYSLGVVVYELLARNRLNGNGDDVHKIAERVLHEPPPDIGELRHDVPPALVQLLFVLLAKDRELRPKSALMVAEALDALDNETKDDDNESKDIGSWIVQNFEELRNDKAASIKAALDAVATPSAAQHKRARRVLIAAAASAALLLGTSGAWRLHTNRVSTTDQLPNGSVSVEASNILQPIPTPPSTPAQAPAPPPTALAASTKVRKKRTPPRPIVKTAPVAPRPAPNALRFKDAPIFTEWK